ncbi:MAG TPA: Ig-like domain-containing protein [Saprospiraceae bacterium]|nr:Ig-like domain-containing protein [Lewinellaceae bacterium]HQU57587.1 Ig-like domain-containing protein [Saprospiraceae bacterium]
MRRLKAPILSAIALALTFCANPLPPEGGLKDVDPPKLVVEESTPNFQTKFQKKTIELTFDEWVEVQDVFNQVVVSPPLEYKFELSLKRKTVRFSFDEREQLRPEATYTINFGEAVKDLNERNPAENLRFVFSTGDFIDSLSVTGIIVDAQTAKPVESALFMLYDNLSDTVVRTERPFYFARTGKDGRFQIENVKAGLFKGFALKDANLNYRFDQALEPIGFPDSLLVVSDSLQPDLLVKLFTEERPLRLLESDDSRYGLVRLAFSKAPEGLNLSYEDVGQQNVAYEINPDTTKVWFDLPEEKSWKLYLRQDTVLNDTVQVRSRNRQDFLEKARLSFRPQGSQVININPSRPIELAFNHPVLRYDTSLIRFYEDTLRTLVQPQLSLDTNGQRRLSIAYPWKEGLPYEMELMPGAFTDIYGLQNDTIIQKYKAELRKNFGNLALTIDSLSADTSYIVELLGKGDELVERFLVQGLNTFQQSFTALPPGNYSVRIITDWNGNGRWDSGNYDLYLQPEPISQKPLEQQLRASWDLESTIILERKVVPVLEPVSGKPSGGTPGEKQGPATRKPPSRSNGN